MPMFKKSMLILLVLALAALGGTMYGYSQRDEAVPLDSGSTRQEGAANPATVTVYVPGAVNKPGVVTLTEGARLADAVNACGGILPTGDSSRVNLAQALKDGQKINVPEKAAPPGKAAASGKQEEQLINLNTADAKALDSLPGVGPSTAKKIIEYRETEGGFKDISDLKKIKGIGEAKYARLKDKVCI